MDNHTSITPFKVRKTFLFKNGKGSFSETNVVTEKSVDLTVNGEFWLTFLCTPQLIKELCAGFLFNEYFISSVDEIADIQICKNGENVDIWLTHSVEKPASWRKTSGCAGGMTSIDFRDNPQLPDKPFIIYPEQIESLTTKLYEHQEIYHLAGGVHTSVLTDGLDYILAAEDIGRHNTLDKIAGRHLFANTHKDNLFLITTGRISSEMLQKAVRLNSIVVISRSSPSSLSVSLADELGITLIGYARGNSFISYTHHQRISMNHQD